jgi:deazaflavin-dependent oxidoreductase (nitroreductase family)
MSKPDLYQILDSVIEIELTVKGRKSGNDLSRPVWFVREDNILYLLPVNGSDTNWYKNMLVNPMLKLSINSKEILSANGRPITDKNQVADVVRKFNSRYSEGEVKKYYTKFDAAVQVLL